MATARDALEEALAECGGVRARIGRGGRQVRSARELKAVRGLAARWFEAHRRQITAAVSDAALAPVDARYQRLIEMTGRAASRSGYGTELRALHGGLIALQAADAVALSATAGPGGAEPAPDFALLVGDAAMAGILERRWRECSVCLAAGAPLAAAVMMGGLLEGMLLAKINVLPDKSAVFTASSAPKDRQFRTRSLDQWRLKDLLTVARELGWISSAAHQVGQAVRDYRNLIHPEREYRARDPLRFQDAKLMWEVCQHILRELLVPPVAGRSRRSNA
ncbi:MAG: hypothetical protein ACRD2E_10495 [Terriglobales bacterium]